MREILFRGKRIDNGKWIEGGFSYGGNRNESIICPKHDFSKEVLPETVGQYTGLRDCKRTKEYPEGQKIFEGDYIVCRQAIEGNFIDEHIEIGYVEMKHGAFGLHRKQGYYRPFKDWLEDYEYEVLGNIHDNPELLKGE